MKVTLLLILSTLYLAACQPTPAPQWRWERVEAGLPRQAIVTSVAANPLDPNHLWAGYYAAGGLATSLDGGQTWTPTVEGLGENPVFSLLIVSRGNGVDAWAATRQGLRHSLDGGAGWQLDTKGLPHQAVFALAADATGRIYAGLDDGGVYTRTPDEQTWQSLSTEEPLASAAVLSLAVSSDGQRLYAGTSARGVFASRDGGKTWSAEFPGAYVPNLALNPNDPKQVMASLGRELARTRDGGQSWQTLPAAWVQAEVDSLLWLPDGTLGVGASQGGLYRSLDGGDTWIEGRAGLAGRGGVLDLERAEDGQLLAGTWGGVYGSRDGGETWQELAPSLGSPMAQVLLNRAGELLLGTQAGLFRWQPATRNWLALPTGFPSEGVQALALDPANLQVLYAGTLADGLYRSDDAGQSWQRLPALGVGIPGLAIDPADSQHLYLLAAWERVYESRDGGQTWQANWNGLGETLETASIAVDAATSGGSTVYVGAETGLYRSQRGRDWEQIAPLLADQSVLALLVQPQPSLIGGNSTLYIGATRGIYRSNDGGASLQSCTSEAPGWGCGLEQISVTVLLADPARPQRLYAGTAYHGVYQSFDGGYTWHSIGPAELNGDLIASLAWGPEGELFVAVESGVWRGVAE
ncbi:MAG: hypothetical protein KJ077_01915 [Anaerolineae bacterium]|nr:hypothetical protein [Anaerolineae bacterium]